MKTKKPKGALDKKKPNKKQEKKVKEYNKNANKKAKGGMTA
jgi:hypothetical protein